jgi:hypothetical protein
MACGPNVDQARPARRWQRRPASRLADARQTPPAAPTSEPRQVTALVGGALAGSGPGTSPCIDGLSLVTAMGYPSLLPVQTIRTTAASWLRTPPGRPPSRSTAGRTVRWAWHDRSEASACSRAGRRRGPGSCGWSAKLSQALRDGLRLRETRLRARPQERNHAGGQAARSTPASTAPTWAAANLARVAAGSSS